MRIICCSDLVKKTTSIEKHTIEIEERGIKLRLTVVDTPGILGMTFDLTLVYHCLTLTTLFLQDSATLSIARRAGRLA